MPLFRAVGRGIGHHVPSAAESCGNAGPVEGVESKKRLSTLSTSPLEISPKGGEIPTFPQLLRRSRMEKWKTKPGFPLSHRLHSPVLNTKAAGGFRSPRRRLRAL